ncbi:MAG: condensation domain-containing protein, partial [Chitinophagaceae bacterium]
LSALNIPVYIINWGYWGEVGVVSTPAYRQRMAAMGVDSITAEDGMRVLETVLSNEQKQVTAIKLTNHGRSSIPFIREEKLVRLTGNHSAIRLANTKVPVFKDNAQSVSAFHQVCSKGLLQVLVQLGFEQKQVKETSIDELSASLGITVRHKRLFEALINLLEDTGYIIKRDGRFVIPEAIRWDLDQFQLEDSLNEFTATHKEYRAHARLLQRCLNAFEAILTGQIPATEVIFPQGSLEHVSGIYKGHYQADYFNDLLADIIARSVAGSVPQLKAGQKLRILEVGAGTGATSEVIFKKLAPFKDHIEYVYTDLSKSFLLHAEQTYRELAPYLQTVMFDIEQSPFRQGLQTGDYDIVIGANVVHATKDIANTLRNIKAVLKKDGLLILNELGRTELFTTLTFGLLDGWWLYEDKELRLKGSPGLSFRQWTVVLAEEGFYNTKAYPATANLSQHIIVAESNGTIISEEAVEYKKTKKVDHKKEQADVQIPGENLYANAGTYLKTLFARVLKMEEQQIDASVPFEAFGVDSILIGSLSKEISKELGPVPAPVFFEYNTIDELSKYLAKNYAGFFENKLNKPQPRIENVNIEPQRKHLPISTRFIQDHGTLANIQNSQQEIAIIAMGGIFTDANDPAQLWSHVASGKTMNGGASPDNGHFYYGKVKEVYNKAHLEKINLTEAQFSAMGRQQKMLFDVLGQAMKVYAITADDLSSRKTGVFIAAQQQLFTGYNEIGQSGYDDCFSYLIPNKISFQLNLTGPSEVINTYCTSVYVALHRAIQSIQLGECDQAIIGGVNVISEKEANGHSMPVISELLSTDKTTRSFCDNGAGFVRSEGAGVLIIKSVKQAHKDNNTILALVKGSAVNHGGKSYSLEAPNAKGIKEAIRSCIKKTGLDTATIDYIEAHGIANRVADAIEVSAISNAYKEFSSEPQKHWHIGSVKPTIGHPELASGVASLIKVIKSFQNKIMPGIPGLTAVNTELEPGHSIILNSKHTQWTNGKHPRRASLNSYSIGGVNAHIILEEYHGPENGRNNIEKTDSEIIELHNEEILKDGPEAASEAGVIDMHHQYQTVLSSVTREVFGMGPEEIDAALSPVDYGFDSIKVIEFIRTINKSLDINIKLGAVLSLDNFGDLFLLIEKAFTGKYEPENTNNKLAGADAPQLHFPLSEGQKGLWLIQHIKPGNTAYNVPLAFAIPEAIKDEQLCLRALKSVLEEYPMLNVGFGMDEKKGEIYQKINTQAKPFLDYKNIQHAHDIKNEFLQLLRKPFDLQTDALLRLHLRIDTATNKTYVLFVIHHIVFDGMSSGILVKSFLNRLKQLIKGDNVLMQPQDLAYFNFIEWENAYITGKEGNESLSYWQNKLSGLLPALNLPYDNISPGNKVEAGCEKLKLEKTELEKLKLLSRKLKVNLSVLLLSV